MIRRRLDLIVDLTSCCNLRCIMCYFSSFDRLTFKPYDLETDRRGNMSEAMLNHLGTELFPLARSLGIGCATEPLLHPRFEKVLEIARANKIQNTWIQTNLLALDESIAEAMIADQVRTVAVSIDGTSRSTYEKIRSGASWKRLHDRLAMLRSAKDRARSRLPRLRVTFAWMQSNREQLLDLPRFAEGLGASEIDDVSRESLDHEDPEWTKSRLWAVARDATRRGLRLAAFPALAREKNEDRSLAGRIRRRVWLIRSGVDGPARWRQAALERRYGCSFPGRTFLIRPNGAVLPCPFWEDDPAALVPTDRRREILGSETISRARNGLLHGCPVGSCRTCAQKKDALFRPRSARAASKA